MAIAALFDFLVGFSIEQIAAQQHSDISRVERLLRYALALYGFSAASEPLGRRGPGS